MFHGRSSAAGDLEECSSEEQLVKLSQHPKRTHSIVLCVEGSPIVHFTEPLFVLFLL